MQKFTHQGGIVVISAKKFAVQGIRFAVEAEGREVGRAYLYILKNDLHEQPFGLLEDVFVEEDHRGGGYGSLLLGAVLARARTETCYKLIATSRTDGTRGAVHAWYRRLGFELYGREFRINL